MIPCICINDKGRPKNIPVERWLKKGQKYHVIYTVYVLPQRQLAVYLSEINLDESCAPYEYFLAKRFAFTDEDLDKLIQMIRDCSDTDFDIDELMDECINKKGNVYEWNPSDGPESEDELE
jgi:hypothetical protein